MVVSGGAIPPRVGKYSDINCPKLAARLRSESITPAGTRVEPEVYCRYMVSGASSPPGASRCAEPLRASRSMASTSMTVGTESAVNSATYALTLGATADVVRMTDGDVSARTALTRSSWDPTCGTDSGTAINPAWMAPRKAAM